MRKKDFETFLEKQASEDKRNKTIDWTKETQDWLGQIDEFYRTVLGWLKEYVDEGRIQILFDPTTLNEEYIGSYETQRLLLRMASHEVVFAPIGTLLVGARGRIDMTGIAGTVRFVLVDKEMAGMSITVRESTDKDAQGTGKDKKQINWMWKISTPPPSINLIELNAESFFDSLLQIMNT